MRRRESKSNNTRPRSIHSSRSGAPLCERCHEKLKEARRPRVNARGLRVATMNSLFRDNKQVPMLRLTGRWLAVAGFEIGQLIEIEVQRGRLTILIASEMEEETRPIAA